MGKRAARLFPFVFFALLLLPARAFGFDLYSNGSYWGGSIGSDTYGSIVRADSQYDAAAYSLGHDPATLSSDVKSRLSDPSYGGAFYQFAQTFSRVEGWDDFPEWVPTYALASFGAAQSFERVYSSEATLVLRAAAEGVYDETVSNPGGGSGGAVASGYSAFAMVASDAYSGDAASDANLDQSFVTYEGTFDNGVVSLTGATSRVSPWLRNGYYISSMRIYVPYSIVEDLNVYIDQGYQVVFAYAGGPCLYVGRDFRVEYRNINGDTMYRVYGNDIRGFRVSGNIYYDSDGPYCFFPADSDVSLTNYSSPISNGYKSGEPIYLPFVTPPAGNWPAPSEPEIPTAPEIPDPETPASSPDINVQLPSITWPSISLGDFSIGTGLDYTDLLYKIVESLELLRSDLASDFTSVITAVQNIYRYLLTLDSILEKHCVHLKNQMNLVVYELEVYLEQLFDWLTKQISFDFDDSDIVGWLRSIYNKMSNGSVPTSYRPNPQSDEGGFFDWLSDLWHRFLIDLQAVLPDELGSLLDTFSQLTHYFPFSIPWDLFALLGLFAHDPVIPVVDIPFMTGTDMESTIHVDLTSWDYAVSMCRPVFLAIFCFELAKITGNLLKGLDLDKGGV